MPIVETLSSLLLFLLPFDRIPSVEIVGFTIRLSSLVILLFLFWGVPKLIAARSLWPVSKLDIAIGGLMVWMVISTLWATSVTRAVTVCALWGFILLGYLLVSRAFRRHFDFDRVSRITVWAGAVTAVFGLWQFFGESFGLPRFLTGLGSGYGVGTFAFPRVQSVGVEPLYYANYLIVPIVMAAVTILTSPKNDWRVPLLATVLGWAFVLTLSRGAFIGLGLALAGLVVYGLIAPRLRRRVPTLIGVVFVAVGLAVVSVMAVAGQSGSQAFTEHAFNAEASRAASANPRLERYAEAIRLWKTSPLIGIGAGQFGIVSTLPFTGRGHDIVNNQYLETLVETGVIGLTLLGWIGLAVVQKLAAALKDDTLRRPAIVLLVSLAAIAIQYNFFSTLYILHIWAWVGLVEAMPSRLSKS